MGSVPPEPRTQTDGNASDAPPGVTPPIRSYAPATGALLGEVPVFSAEDVTATVARARKAQAAWAVLPTLGFRRD